MSRLIDITGERHGRLVVLKYHGSRPKHTEWLCRCDCGKEVVVLKNNLQKSGNTQSCGCLNTEAITKHGMCDSPEYTVWENMIARCHNKKNPGYHNYGLRGIKVCRRWRKFENFIADVGRRPKTKGRSRYWIERIENSKGYRPGNVYWATPLDQGRNRRNNRKLRMDGKSLCVSEWSEITGINVSTIRKRLRIGWSVRLTLTVPVGSGS